MGAGGGQGASPLEADEQGRKRASRSVTAVRRSGGVATLSAVHDRRRVSREAAE